MGNADTRQPFALPPADQSVTVATHEARDRQCRPVTAGHAIHEDLEQRYEMPDRFIQMIGPGDILTCVLS